MWIDGEIDSFKYEKRYVHRHGDLVWTLLSASLVHDEYGHPLYIISQVQDITEYKRAAAAERAVYSPAAMRRRFVARISPRTDSPIPSYPF